MELKWVQSIGSCAVIEKALITISVVIKFIVIVLLHDKHSCAMQWNEIARDNESCAMHCKCITYDQHSCVMH